MHGDGTSAGTERIAPFTLGHPSADGLDVRSASLGELLKRLSADGGHLVQQEIQLAKAELHESAATAAAATGKIAVAGLLMLPGILALTAALIIGLGVLMDNYWLSSLLVGAVILVGAGVMAKRAMAGFKAALAPRATLHTLQDDAAWAKRETTRVKQKLSA
jgi:uncharacterized membrane protein YqjE